MNKINATAAFLSLLCVSPAAAVPQDSSPADRSDPASSQALPAAERKGLIDSIGRALAESYVFPEKVPAIAAKLRFSERAGRYSGMTPPSLADAMNADIHSVVQDAHLAVQYSATPLPVRAPDQEPSAAERAERDAFFRSMNYGIRKVEVLEGNVGYLSIDGFLDAGKTAPIIDAAMTFLSNAGAIVLDLRGNHGGSPETVALVASYLLPAKTHINDIYLREGNLTKQFWTNSIAENRRISDKVPVYVLTDKRTASAGEELAYDLQQLKRATIVGEPTWGGANPGGTVRLSDHFGIFVPGGRAINPITKTNWEGVGVRPDVPIAADQALTKAMDLLRSRQK